MKLITNLLTIICFLFFGLQHTLGQCDGTSDIIQNSSNSNLTTSTSINVGMGNSFTATCSGVIEGVSFWTLRAPGTIGAISVTVELYRNPFSSSRVLLSSYTTDTPYQNEGALERYFPFENSPSLVAGTVYGVRLIVNDSDEFIDMLLHTGNRLSNGTIFADNFDTSGFGTRDLRFQIHYEDNVDPIANCRNITRSLGANNTVSITTGNINNNSIDADSGIATYFLSQNTFDCSNLGENTVTLTVRDQNGNTDSCQATVTIIDETAPVLTCPGDMTVYTDPGFPAVVNYADIIYEDCTVATTPNGYTFLAARNGKNYFLSQNQVLPSAAFTASLALGGHLATIENEEDNDIIRSAASAIINTDAILIGYNDIASEGNFVWQSGSSSTYTNWDSSEPNNVNNQDFTEIGSDGKWSDIGFNVTRYFVVELPQGNISQTSGLPSGATFPLGITTNTFEATDAFGNTGTCSFDVTVLENAYETSVTLADGKLTITDIGSDSDDAFILSSAGGTLTISNLLVPQVSGGITLQNQTTVTVPLSSITKGIEIDGGNGTNEVILQTSLTLLGADNDILIQNISAFDQPDIIEIGGTFSIIGSADADILLNRLTATGLSITGVHSISDVASDSNPIQITGNTTLQSISVVDLDNSNHNFTGLVDIEASRINVVVFGSGALFNDITTTDSSVGVNLIRVQSGELQLTGTIQTAGLSQLELVAFENIIQSSGSITTDVLTLRGRDSGQTSAFLDSQVNNIRVLETTDQNTFLNSIFFADADNVEIGRLNVGELKLTANTIIFTEQTALTVDGTATSRFIGNVEIDNPSNVTQGVINHYSGIINFEGSVNDLDGLLDYNSLNGVTTNFSGTTTLNTAGVSPVFGTINATGTYTVNVFTDILNEARFSGASTVLKGRGSLDGAPVIVENDATITPGSIGDVTSLSLSDLSITDATFAPVIENDLYDYDILEVQGTLTLNNATLSPITNAGTFGNLPITLIDNDGTDAIVGTFNNYPEGSIIQIESYIGAISYVGGDGNDVVITPMETNVELSQGKLTITDVNGGTSDDQISFTNDGTTLTISNLTAPVQVIGGPTSTDATTVTIPITNITNGIEFVSEGGNNAITITDDLNLSGATNAVKLNNLAAYTQTGALTIGGDLEIIGDGNVTIDLNEISAGSLIVNNNGGITDTGGSISITGTTTLVSSGNILIDQGQGNHQFGGIVNLDANGAFFTAGADTTFGTITVAEPVVGSLPFLNYLAAVPGTIDFNDTVSVPGTADIDSNLFVYSTEEVTQSSGTITVDFLVLYGNGATVVTLDKANALRGLTAVNPFNANNIGVSNVTVKSTETLALEQIIVNEFNITAPIMRTFPDFTIISKNGSGESILNANVFVQNGTSGTGSGIIEHNSGTITIIGDTIDLTGRITYDGAAGTVTNLNANTVKFPFTSDNANVTFGTLNANTNVNIGDDTITILNEANFSGSGTVVNGTATIAGGTTTISNAATITPGTSTVVGSVTTVNLEITDATYAPRVESDTSFDNISVIGSVILSNATLNPTEGFVSDVTNAPIILISNDGIDPVIGTFNNLPENTGVSFGDYVGMITYSGGNGNDVSLVPDTIAPTPVCQDLNFVIGLDGITINATQIDNGSTDNAGIASLLINGQSQIDFTYDDLGSNVVTLTVTDTSGNTAECMATITLTSDVTFPILISEYQPQTLGFPANQTIEIKGEPGEVFVGTFVIIDGDQSRNGRGVVVNATDFSGTFDTNGLLTADIPNFTDPSHTAVLTSSFSGQVNTTDIDADDDGTADDLSAFGVIFDAVGVSDGGVCCPLNVQYGTDFGGVDLASIGNRPDAIFRTQSTGDFFQLNGAGTIFDSNGSAVDASLFDNAPTNNGTFGQINPAISLNMNQMAFITTWKTDNSGSSNDDQITIFTDSNETYDYIIDWGDGTSDSNVTGNITHTYSTAGTYTIGIVGTFPKFVSSGDKLKLLSVDQWGDITWTSFNNAFRECRNMDVVATDVPDLSNVTSLFAMFDDCQSLVGNPTFNMWDVSTIQTTQLMFINALSFNQPLDNWNVSNVTNMSSMFNGAEAFNQDLNNWNTSQVQFMDFMFLGAVNFNGQIDNWNVSNVTEMSYMFNQASAFNQDLNSWNVSNVQEMDFMFLEATNFNGDISSWNPAQVTTMNAMFQNAVNFNQDISGWNVANVSDMGYMFRDATNFNQNLSNWDVSNVATADFMLTGTAFSARNYDLLLINWNQLTLQNNVNFGTDAGFCLGETAKQSISTNHSWNFTDGGQNCGDVFVTKWKTDNAGTSADNQITIPTATALGTTYNYNVDWGDGTVQTNITGDATHTYATAGTYTVRILGDFPHFYFNLTGDYLKLLEIEQWGSNPWSSMERAFRGCENLVISATDAPDLSNVINIDRMLQAAGRNIDMSLWADISHWDLSNVESMSSFLRDTNFNQNIGAWNVSNVTNMSRVFQNNPVFNQDISTWNVGNVTNMFGMFFTAREFNQNIGAWDVSKVENMRWMLRGMPNFNQDLSAWDISSITAMDNMFSGSTLLSTENYDNTLIGWATLDAGETQIPTNVTFHANLTTYCDGEYKRQELIDNFGWNITDAGKAADCNNYFITTWETTADNESITIPTDVEVLGYDYLIDWGDGTVDVAVTGDATHTYATAGTYTVSITGAFPKIHFSNSGDRLKIREVQQWGTNAWSNNMESAFAGCENLDVTATDTPDLSNITSIAVMFENCTSLVGNASFNAWDVSTIQAFFKMFKNASSFNQPLDNWNVSQATSISSMFQDATAFNQDISGWDVSNVRGINRMFQGATSFDQNLGSWDISSLGEGFGMEMRMFQNAGLSTENYDNTLIGWATLDAGETQIPSNINFDGGSSEYCLSELERTQLIETYNWNIIDSGKEAGCINPNSFITTWETTTDNESITIPTTGTGYNYIIDWGDGTIDTGITGDATHTYTTAGIYTVSILGDFPRIYFNFGGDSAKITEVVQWGSNTWTSMALAFTGCVNLDVIATDTPDLSQATNILGMFAFCTNLTGNTSFSSWDVSNIETMEGLFFGSTNFNQNISSWNVSSVTNMRSLFADATNFNQPLDNWNVSNVTNMQFMFQRATNFNQPLASWNVAMVENMEAMFEEATNFNQPLENWNVSNVTNMANMFSDASNFDQPLANWNVSNVENMRSMFLRAEDFNQPLNSWNVSSVMNMELMFGFTTSFNQDISNWDVSNVTSIQLMFANTTAFDQSLGNWDISSLTGFNTVFTNAGISRANYDSTLIGWATLDTGETQIPSNINFDGGSSEYCLSEFERAQLIETYNWNIIDSGKEAGCINPNSFITTWETTADNESITIPTTGTGYNYIVDWGDGTIETGITGNASHNYANAGTHTVSILGDFPRIYFNFSFDSTKIQEVQQWGTIEWTSMERAFTGCSNLEVTATDAPNLTNVTNTSRMFNFCSSLLGNAIFNTWDVSTIEDMSHMFSSASNFNTDLNNWNVSNVTNMNNMFSNATIFNGNISTWNTGEVTNMTAMFFSATAFEGIGGLNSWNVSNVTQMFSLFDEASSFNKPLDTWDVSNVTDMYRMFYNATLFNQDLSNWDVSSAFLMNEMFLNTAMSVANYDNLLNAWANLTLQPNVGFGISTAYCQGETARQYIIDTFDWVITDNGLDASCNIENSIITFSLLEEIAAATIDDNNSTVTIAVPYTANITTLAPTITVSDGATINPDSGVAQDFTAPVLYTVTSENGRERQWTVTVLRAPSITNMSVVNVQENQLSVTDVDTIDPEGDTESNGLIYSFTTINGGVDNGLFNIDMNTGIISFISAPDFEAPIDNDGQNDYEVQVTVTTSNNLSDTKNITVVVTNANEMPNAVDDTATTDEDSTVTIELTANDTDIDGDDLEISSVDNTGLLGQVSIQADNDNISYDPNGSFDYLQDGEMATDTFTYTVSDGSSSDIGTVEITITGINDPVQAVDDFESTFSNETVTISVGSNDIDPDNDNLNITSIDTTGILGGLVTVSPDGSTITFDPNGEFDQLALGESQQVSFSYTITDGLTTDTATVFINVEGGSTEGAFVTTWTVNAGESITIPTNANYTYDYIIIWGDGTDDINADFNVTGDITHTYTDAGTYTVKILGQFPAINFGASSDTDKIQTIEQWGTIQWATMEDAFEDCANLNITNPNIDVPDLSNVTSTADMFYDCVSFNGDVTNWDVSNVQDFNEMFGYCYVFNQPIGGWNMSNATNLDYMFYESPIFNQPLNNWNTSNVITMEGVFEDAQAFDQDLNNWDVSNVTSMEAMFQGAIVFNGDISSWNVSNVQNMEKMFDSAYLFNQDISNWDVSNVEDMGDMFEDAEVFNQDISGWNVGLVRDMHDMFKGADAFDQNLGDWDLTSIVYNGFSNSGLRNMFGGGPTGNSLSIANYDSTLIGWNTDSSGVPNDGIDDIPTGIVFGGGRNEYCSGEVARQNLISTYGWSISDRGLSDTCGDAVLEAKVCLQGAAINPNVGEENLMRDDLRVAGMIPTRSPYPDMLFCEPTVFDVGGTDAIVDWIWVELRDATDNTSIIAGQSALLQRDGDIVSADGVSTVEFDVASGNYYVAIKHRNHLGIMSANSIALSNMPTMIDFTDGSTPTFGSNAQTSFGMPAGVVAMWTGNTNGDAIIQYSGTSPDTPEILSTVLNDPGNFLNFPTYAVSGYLTDDINMDGNTQYSGVNPDSPVILQNVIAHPGNFLNFSTYQIIEQLPNN